MRFPLSLLLVILFFSCSHNNDKPDISGIKVVLTTDRFEKSLFAIDSSQLTDKLDPLLGSYGDFGNHFLTTILNADEEWPKDTINKYVGSFINSYQKIYDTAEILFSDFSKYENQISTSLQYLKYYFPNYKAPKKIITYIGPLDGYGDIITDDALIVGLHLHLGNQSSFYQADWFQETYPSYIYSRFEPEYIVVNCMKNIINDMFPKKGDDAPLSFQMVEAGKRLYLLEKFIPDCEKFRIIGYTKDQLNGCYEHEKAIWDLFIQNDLLESIDKNIIKNYLGESPKTQELGEASPGNIGAFVGWQIVKKYMSKHSSVTLDQLMKIDPEEIIQMGKYKP
jgi:hypothetical protein